jgi:hypothetical protein
MPSAPITTGESIIPIPGERRAAMVRGWVRCAAIVVPAIVALTFPSGEARRGPARGAAVAAPPGRERVRARPPVSWPALARATFFDDAFTTLEGQRPDFSALAGSRAANAGPDDPGSPAAVAGDGFRWSGLVSPDTLTDEVKDMNATVQEAIASATTFKGGGYEAAREAFSSIALVFGVIAAYDGDIRWKKDAAMARDLFARVGFNCKVGTDQSLSESKARAADLAALLEGNGLPSRSERDPEAGEPIWSQVAARPALMARLERADAVVSAAVASRTEFTRAAAQLLHEVEMAAIVAEVIQRKDFEYHDDETYRGYAAAMRDAALKARAAAAKDDFDGVRAAAGDLKKSCDACHGDYRS